MNDRPATFDIFVGNLPQDVQKDDLSQLFKKFGRIASITVMPKKDTPDRAAFVRYYEEDDANSACAEKTHIMGGKKLVVNHGKGSRKGPDTGGGINKYKSNRDGLVGPRPVSTSGSFGENKPPMPSNYSISRTGSSGPIMNKPDMMANHPMNKKFLGPAYNDSDASSSSSSVYPYQQRPNDVTCECDGSQDTGSVSQEKVVVTHVSSPTVFWGNQMEDQLGFHILALQENVREICDSTPPVLGQPLVGKVYGARFSEDSIWYRCRINKNIGALESEVLYVDFGNGEVVQNTDIRELPQKLGTEKTYAKKYALLGLRSLYDKEVTGFEQGRRKLLELLLSKTVDLTVHSTGPAGDGPAPVVAIREGGMDIGQEMVSLGFVGERSPGTSGRDGAIGRPGFIRQRSSPSDSGGNFRPPPQRAAPDRLQINQGADLWDEEAESPRNNVQPFRGPAALPMAIGNWEPSPVPAASPPHVPSLEPMGPVPTPMLGMPHSTPPGLEVSQLHLDLRNAHREINKMRVEVAACQKASGEIRDIELERNCALLDQAKLKGEVKLLEANCNQMRQQLQEMGLNQRLKMLFSDVQKLKKLRVQFPTDRESTDNIEWAMELLQNNTGSISADHLPTHATVRDLLSQYTAAQEHIRHCGDVSLLEELTSSRDVLRRQLHAALQEFEQMTSELPLEEKTFQYTAALHALETTYSNLLQADVAQTMPLSNILDIYSEWKTNNTPPFREKRAFTNSHHHSLHSALDHLQQQLSLDMSTYEDSSTGMVACLDEPLKKYQTSVREEIKVTDVESSRDAATITMVLKTLVALIHSELSEIVRLAALKEEYTSHLQQLSVWLDARPQTQDLLNARKTIKALKSRLRHKLADKQDIEESEESEMEELKKLGQDITEIRDGLQEAFQTEDAQLTLLADVCENHFPELSLQYAELGMENEIEFGGLVKLGRSMEYFDTKPLEKCAKSSVLKSTFCKLPVILKEFIVDDSLGIRKDDFLRRAMAYNNITNLHITPIQAIYFVKGKRSVYLQLPAYEKNAEQMLSTTGERLSDKNLHALLKGVLEGLRCLHEAKLVHGAVHLCNVFRNHQGEGVLADVDFTKSLQQRAEREYVSPSGLKFVPPEMYSTRQITRASDIYNFGLVALSLLKPTIHIVMQPNGVPDIRNLHIHEEKPELSAVIQSALIDNPATRPSAKDLLGLAYFIHKPESRRNSPIELLTLQLRPKQPSPPLSEKTHSGILKRPSPVTSPMPVCTPSPTPIMTTASPQPDTMAMAASPQPDTMTTISASPQPDIMAPISASPEPDTMAPISASPEPDTMATISTPLSDPEAKSTSPKSDNITSDTIATSQRSDTTSLSSDPDNPPSASQALETDPATHSKSDSDVTDPEEDSSHSAVDRDTLTTPDREVARILAGHDVDLPESSSDLDDLPPLEGCESDELDTPPESSSAVSDSSRESSEKPSHRVSVAERLSASMESL